MKNLFLALFLTFGIIVSGLNAQNPSVQIASVTECPGNELLIPVNITDFENIGAITLFIAFDTTVAHFNGLENIHPQFLGMFYNLILFPQPKIGIVWQNIGGVTVEEGKLFDIKFNYNGGTSALSFIGDCEIADTDAVPLEAEFIDGSLSSIIPILNQPESITVTAPEPVQFSVVTQGEMSYQWQLSTDGGMEFTDLSNSIDIQGVNTPDLQLLVSNTNMDGYLFRCWVSDAGCELLSEAAMLSVLSGILTTNILLPKGWSSLSSYIDPEDPQLEILFEQILESIEILVSGEQIFYPQGGINTIGDFDPYLGYSIKMSAGQSLEIVGYKVENNSILVSLGWSYLPVLSPCDVLIDEISSDFMKNVTIIQEIAGIDVYWPQKDVSTLEQLKSGRSYLILMRSADTIVFPECD